MGRPSLSLGEMRRMITVESIIDAARSRARYRDKDGANNWAEWAAQNPTANALLNSVEEMIANGE